MKNEIKQIIILDDFIKLLSFIDNNEAKLTATKSFNLKTLAAIGNIIKQPEHFKNHRMKGEYEWRQLEYLDALGQIMKLTVDRKHCRKLSKYGKEYLKKPLEDQFIILFGAYWDILNWACLFPFKEKDNENPACHLWNARNFVLNTMLEKQSSTLWIDFKEFAEYLRMELNLKMINYLGKDLPDRVHDCIKTVIIDQFESFRLIEVKYKTERLYNHDFKKIDSFHLTSLVVQVILSLLPSKEFIVPENQTLH